MTWTKDSPPKNRDEVTLRLMRASDVPFANELRQFAGWNQTERDWRNLLTYDPDGCFVAEVAGKPAGTATTIRYGHRFGWIGMVLVHPDYRRIGLGTQLLDRAIRRLQEAGMQCIKLDATPMGKKVYVPLGFVDEYEMARYEGIAVAPGGAPASDIVAFSAADFDALARLDSEAFGADRVLVLRTLAERGPELCFAAQDARGVVGFLMARDGASAVQIGPWIARDAFTAERLLQALFRRVSGRRVFLDVLDPNPPAVDLVRRQGFTVQRTLTRMFLGRNAHPGDPRLIFGISGPEKG